MDQYMTMNINDFCPLDEYIPCIHLDGRDWFFAENVCRALQIEGGPNALKRHLSERSWLEITPAYARTNDDRVLLISEDVFYEQVLVRNVPAAERFTSWVLTVVLPTMLEDGIYIPGEEHSYPTPDCKHEDLSVWNDESIWADESRHWEIVMWWEWVYRVLTELRFAEVGILDPYVLKDESQSARDAAFRRMLDKKIERRDRMRRAAA
jgi:prophage antirepressor-like protein